MMEIPIVGVAGGVAARTGNIQTIWRAIAIVYAASPVAEEWMRERFILDHGNVPAMDGMIAVDSVEHGSKMNLIGSFAGSGEKDSIKAASIRTA